MGRPGLSRHPKFLKLARALGNPLAARGALEFLWETAYEAGDPRLGSPEDVEAVCRWEGKGHPKGKLFEALRTPPEGYAVGFIEPSPGGGWQVHDLFHHAPDYVKKREDRETLRSRRAEAGRKGAEARWGAMANGWQSHPGMMANDGTPAPAPAPAPALPQTPSEPPQLDLVPVPESVDRAAALMALWNRLRGPNQPEAKELGKVRRARAEAALARRPLEQWEQIFLRLASSDLCNGSGGQGWVADFDFAIRAEGKERETAAKVLEGKYDNRRGGKKWEDEFEPAQQRGERP